MRDEDERYHVIVRRDEDDFCFDSSWCLIENAVAHCEVMRGHNIDCGIFDSETMQFVK